MEHKNSPFENVGAVIALAVIAVYGFTVVMPYFLPPQTNPDLIQLIDRSKGTVDTVTVAVIMFYFGGTVGRRMAEQVMEKQASTIQAAQAALTPTEPGIPLGPGESVKVTADGTDTGKA